MIHTQQLNSVNNSPGMYFVILKSVNWFRIPNQITKIIIILKSLRLLKKNYKFNIIINFNINLKWSQDHMDPWCLFDVSIIYYSSSHTKRGSCSILGWVKILTSRISSKHCEKKNDEVYRRPNVGRPYGISGFL